MTLGVNMTAVARVVGEYRGVSSPIISQDLARLETAIDFGEGSTWGTYADRLYAATRTISASSSENLDLAGGLTDALGNALTFVQISGVLIKAAAGNTNNVVVGGAGSNTWLGPFGAADNTVSIPPGGSVMLLANGGKGAWPVTASTGDILKVANSSSGTSVSYDIVIWGASSDQLDLALGATDVWDFTTGTYRQDFATRSDINLDTRWSFSRASTGYARTVAGTLTSFAAGSPRITDRGLLIEEQRTNLCLRSQEFDNASWTKSNVTVTADATTAPDGTTTADQVLETVTNGTHPVTSAAITIGNVALTGSIFLKPIGRTTATILMTDGTTAISFVATLTSTGSVSAISGTGSWTNTSAAIEALANGWYRVSFTGTKGAGSTVQLQVLSHNGSTTSFAGDTTKGFYAWGAQLEAGAYASSYIPTTTASATRLADLAQVSYALPTAGTVYGEFVAPPVAASWAGIIGSSTTATPLTGRTGTDVATFNGSTALSKTIATTAAATVKAAVRYTSAGRGLSVNGATVATDSNTFGSITTLVFGYETADPGRLNSYLRKVMLFPRALADAELQALTT